MAPPLGWNLIARGIYAESSLVHVRNVRGAARQTEHENTDE